MKSRAGDRFRFAGYEVTGTVVTKYIRVGNKTLAAKKVGDKLFYHNDHLGGVNVITDFNGLVVQLIEYDPWGKISRSEGGGEGILRFTGQKLDVESGLLYYGGRYYDPQRGKFISPDPFVPDMFNPQSLNRYAYVNNNPVNYIDPSGYFHRHKKKEDSGFFGTIFGAIFGFIFAGPAGAIFGAALAQLPPEVFHGLAIISGIAMVLTGNPEGILLLASGATGFCKNQGCQFASLFLGLASTATSVASMAGSVPGGSGGGDPLAAAEAGPTQLASADPMFHIEMRKEAPIQLTQSAGETLTPGISPSELTRAAAIGVGASSASYWQRWTTNFAKKFNETNRAFFSVPGQAARLGYGFFFSAPRVTSAIGTVSAWQAITSVPSGGIANLGVAGTLTSGFASFTINFAVVNIGFEIGNGIGSAAVALGKTPLPFLASE